MMQSNEQGDRLEVPFNSNDSAIRTVEVMVAARDIECYVEERKVKDGGSGMKR